MSRATPEIANFQPMDDAPFAMAFLEGPEHTFRWANGAFCRLTQTAENALLGRSFAEIAPTAGRHDAPDRLLDHIFHGGGSGCITEKRSAALEPVYWSWSAWAASWPAGMSRGVVVQVSDVTEGRAFQSMAASMNEELITSSLRLQEHSDKMDEADKAKDEFLAMLGHEIRNPLNAIGAAAKLIAMRSSEQEDLHAPVDIVLRQVRHAARLTDDLLNASRMTHGKLEVHRERVDLTAIVRPAVETSRPRMDAAGCKLVVSLCTEPIWLDGDAARLEQVIGNLLENAAKYTGAGGRVEIALRREEGEAVIQVADTGVGIESAMLQRIFDLFTQVEHSPGAPDQGLGIGLALVKRLTEMHGGAVSAASAGEGQGSLFTVRLPAPREMPRAPETAVPAAAASLNILLAEDNADAASTLADVLGMWGHTVHVVSDGRAALEHVRRQPPDIALLDIGLPEMTGNEVARTLRSEGLSNVRLVALTGYGHDEARRRSEDAGFNDYLVKPLDFKALAAILADAGRSAAELRA